ncbi:phosphate signaling complex protein PhoU [Rhodospirillaceae bacterium AH-315-P19]|nr:phosphate signaling complex protein PhoU [Rhodospirillaceae bacterium AH-315-P19]
MTSEHIVKSYDDELNRLNRTIVEMGGLAEAQLQAAIRALVERNSELAVKIIEEDDKIDELNFEVDQFAIQLLALRQPMAEDLRCIVASLKISSDLERIADYATNVAKRVIAMDEYRTVKLASGIPRMAALVTPMIKDVLDAYVARDVDRAIEVWNRDIEVDDMYLSLFRELLTYMMEDPRNITPCTHLLFMAKNIERIGDHVTNIAETVYFLVHGRRLREHRPKLEEGDQALSALTSHSKPEK